MEQGVIARLTQRLTRRDFSCAELTEAYLQAVREENPVLNAYVRVTEDRAREAACRVDARLARGETLRPLEGIPLSLKDNFSTKGIETTCCSRILQGYTPVYDAAVWEALGQNGAVLLGKTNMDEFAMGSSCRTSCYGGARNPLDPSRSPGGSSGGAASAVAAGLCAYALGSDSGGSVRQPASFCGVVGLKPTYGAVSRYGLVAYASSLDQIGPVAACVEDAAAVFDAISGRDPRDSTCRGAAGPTLPGLRRSIRGRKIGWAREWFEGIPEGICAALERAARTYRALGAELVELSLPELSYALPAYHILACAEAASNLGRYDGVRYGARARGASAREAVCRARSEGFGREVKRRILLGTYVLREGDAGQYYQKAQQARRALSAAFRRAFRQCALLLAPSSPQTAFPMDAVPEDPAKGYQSDVCTAPASLAGLPAVSLPCGADENGLPIGLQLVAPLFEEALLLNAAWQFERAAGPSQAVKKGGNLLAV